MLAGPYTLYRGRQGLCGLRAQPRHAHDRGCTPARVHAHAHGHLRSTVPGSYPGENIRARGHGSGRRGRSRSPRGSRRSDLNEH